MTAPEKPKRSGTDLFDWINALYTKTRPVGTPPTYMMHRFLASDREFALLARYFQVEVRDPELVFGIWQAVVPRARTAPRFGYVAAKKGAAEEALVTRMKTVLAESRETVEMYIEMVKLEGRVAELYVEFGVKPPASEETDDE